MRLLIIGLDGADFYVLMRFLPNLPVLGGLVSDGYLGLLDSLEVPQTPPAWCSMYTGCRPEEHGVEGWVWDPCREGGALERPPFWSYLDFPVGLVTLPCVRSAGICGVPSGSFVVPGILTPWVPHPGGMPGVVESLLQDSSERSHGRALWLTEGGIPARKVDHHKERLLQVNEEAEKDRVGATRLLLRKYPVELLFVGVMIVDRVGHAFPPGHPYLRRAYEIADRQIGKLLKLANPERVLLFSDHGMAARDCERVPERIRELEDLRAQRDPDKPRWKGLHTRDGVLIVDDPALPIEGARLWDIAPTVMDILGEPTPGTMSGRSFEQVILERRLKALGYH